MKTFRAILLVSSSLLGLPVAATDVQSLSMQFDPFSSIMLSDNAPPSFSNPYNGFGRVNIVRNTGVSARLGDLQVEFAADLCADFSCSTTLETRHFTAHFASADGVITPNSGGTGYALDACSAGEVHDSAGRSERAPQGCFRYTTGPYFTNYQLDFSFYSPDLQANIQVSLFGPPGA